MHEANLVGGMYPKSSLKKVRDIQYLTQYGHNSEFYRDPFQKTKLATTFLKKVFSSESHRRLHRTSLFFIKNKDVEDINE